MHIFSLTDLADLEEEPVARVPDEEIEQLKKEVDLAELVVRSGVALKKQGKDLVGCCPFHEDDTPSLVVSPSKNLWHCLGACQVGGSVIDWVMKTQGISFRHAIEVLRAGAAPAITPGRASPVAALSRARKLPSPVDVSGEDQAVLSSVVDYYHATLLESSEALAYLSRRRIDDAETIGRFRLGFANRTLGYRLPAKRTKEGDAVRGRLERLGVLRTSGHEHLTGSLVVPVTTPAGAVTELYGRKLRDNLRAGTPLHLYLPGPHRGVWNEEGLSGGEVIVTESLLDALTFFCAGFHHVTASFGTSGFTDDHREAFRRHKVTRVLLAYDHDKAGDEAAAKLSAELMADGIECFRILFPYGADANDVAVSSTSPRDALGALVRAAEWMGAGTRRSAGPSSDDDRPADDGEEEPPLPSAASVSFVAQVPSVATSSASPMPEVSPVPAGPTAPVLPAAAVSHDELVMELGPRRWRVRHIAKTPTPGVLRVNVMVGAGERFHVDTVDLYSAKQRAAYVDAAKTELRSDRDTIAAELGRVLLAVEDAQAAAAAPAAPDDVAPMTTAEREAALSLLTAPDLMDRVAEAFVTLGVVGERTTALVAWLTLTSRLSDRPLGAVVQSSSSAGKSTLADAALSLMPTEQTVSYSAMTGQALYYLGETDLAHKVLSIAEEEGASRASYALKLLVSEGRLSIASAGKDPVTGRLVTHTYEVAGPVALLMTTTSAELDEELANRLLVLCVDEGRHQTRAVHVAQRDAETVEGLVARSVRAEVMALHRHAQRLLAPVAVVNPHAPSLAFSDQQTRARRDNAKYLGLIRAVVLAHQHQRPRKQVTVGGKTVTYIEATETDVAVADGLSADVLGTTTDELSPVSRRLLGAIESFVAERGDTTFTRRELRTATGFGDTQLKVHLARLCDLEYVAANRAGPATTYELAPLTYDRDRSGPESYRSGENPDRSGIGRVPRRSADGPLSQVGGHERGGGDGSVGIGRVGQINENPLPSRENLSSVGDRSGLVRIHGTGDTGPAVVAGA